jgi:hypothetical protein
MLPVRLAEDTLIEAEKLCERAGPMDAHTMSNILVPPASKRRTIGTEISFAGGLALAEAKLS